MSLANSIIESCEAQGLGTRQICSKQFYNAFHLARALARALLYFEKGLKSQEIGTSTKMHGLNRNIARTAATEYILAASYTPDDDDGRSVCLYRALEIALKVGGHKVKDLRDLYEAASRSEKLAEPVFGPGMRSEGKSLAEKLMQSAAENDLKDDFLLPAMLKISWAGEKFDDNIPEEMKSSFMDLGEITDELRAIRSRLPVQDGPDVDLQPDDD